MASHKAKFKLEFEGLEDLIEQYKEIGADIIPVATKALETTHAHITPKIHDKVQKANLPAKGKYSTIDRKNSEKQIIDEANIEWKGLVGSVDIGFSLDRSIVPIFLINGTKDMDPVKGLKSAIYGTKTKEEIAEIQHAVFVEELERLMNNGK